MCYRFTGTGLLVLTYFYFLAPNAKCELVVAQSKSENSSTVPRYLFVKKK